MKRKLTYKQELVVRDVTEKVNQGKSMDILGSTEKFYNAKNRKSASSLVAKNMRNPTFREALIDSLVEKKILGANSKTEQVLLEGLEAETKEGDIAYETRLKYVQEINKVAGVYAPEVKKTLNLNTDMSEKELDQKIKELQEQLE
jgi:hypothetical protein